MHWVIWLGSGPGWGSRPWSLPDGRCPPLTTPCLLQTTAAWTEGSSQPSPSSSSLWPASQALATRGLATSSSWPLASIRAATILTALSTTKVRRQRGAERTHREGMGIPFLSTYCAPLHSPGTYCRQDLLCACPPRPSLRAHRHRLSSFCAIRHLLRACGTFPLLRSPQTLLEHLLGAGSSPQTFIDQQSCAVYRGAKLGSFWGGPMEHLLLVWRLVCISEPTSFPLRHRQESPGGSHWGTECLG